MALFHVERRLDSSLFILYNFQRDNFMYFWKVVNMMFSKITQKMKPNLKLSILFLLFISVFFFQSCKNKKPGFEYSDYPTLKNLDDFNKNDEGAYVLFDGSSLQGWRGYNMDHVPDKWSIEDSTLTFTDDPEDIEDPKGGDLVFSYAFKNFEVNFDWKISKGGNSGVFILGKEVKGKPLYISAPEYQVLDNKNHPDAKLGENGNRKSASLYDMIPAQPQNSKPAGEWNHGKIVVDHGKVTNYQNGEAVVHYELWTPEWTDLLQDSKFSEKDWPLAFYLLNNVGGDSKSGFLGFQDHGDKVWYKNITVKEL